MLIDIYWTSGNYEKSPTTTIFIDYIAHTLLATFDILSYLQRIEAET